MACPPRSFWKAQRLKITLRSLFWAKRPRAHVCKVNRQIVSTCSRFEVLCFLFYPSKGPLNQKDEDTETKLLLSLPSCLTKFSTICCRRERTMYSYGVHLTPCVAMMWHTSESQMTCSDVSIQSRSTKFWLRISFYSFLNCSQFLPMLKSLKKYS